MSANDTIMEALDISPSRIDEIVKTFHIDFDCADVLDALCVAPPAKLGDAIENMLYRRAIEASLDMLNITDEEWRNRICGYFHPDYYRVYFCYWPDGYHDGDEIDAEVEGEPSYEIIDSIDKLDEVIVDLCHKVWHNNNP